MMNYKTYAVIGHPIGHTMSPFIHERLFSLSGFHARYGVRDIAPQDLGKASNQLRELDGFNITIPHKQTIIPLLDSIDEKAARFGSVNTVKNENGWLTGFTTDGEGFRRALASRGILPGGRMVILGAGGAARAIAFECAQAGGRITIATRPHSAAAASSLCENLRRLFPSVQADCCPIDRIEGPADLLINATPAGMFPHTENCPVSAEPILRSRFVFDAIYNPTETALLRLARENGVPAAGGMGMLVHQAAAAQEIWTGALFSREDLDHLCADADYEMKKKFGPIVLCGFMGCGKTSAGRILSKKIRRQFLDLDDWIVQNENMAISQIFKQKGEPYFRSLEAKAVRLLSQRSGLIIATGGGTLVPPQNAGEFRRNGVVVFLDASLEAVRSRLKNDRSRPLLQRPDREEALRSLYESRLGSYRSSADITVDADGTPEQTAVRILEALGEHRPCFPLLQFSQI